MLLDLEDDGHGQVLVALPVSRASKIDAVVDVDGVLDLQIVQLQVADLVVVADADEEQRHALLGGVVRHLADGLVLGGDAVGEHDDGRQRRAAIVVEDLADGGAQAAVVAVGLQVGDRLCGRGRAAWLGDVGDLAGRTPARRSA